MVLTIVSDGITYYDHKSITAMIVFAGIFVMLGVICLIELKVTGLKKYSRSELITDEEDILVEGDDYVYPTPLRVFLAVLAAVFLAAAVSLFILAFTADTEEDYYHSRNRAEITIYPPEDDPEKE